jgi:phage shock protein E
MRLHVIFETAWSLGPMVICERFAIQANRFFTLSNGVEMNLQKIFLVVLSVFFGIFSNANAADHTTDSLETVKKSLADKKAVLLDVREKDEWDGGHLKDAIHLPISKIKGGITVDDLAKIAGKDTVIYLHCKAGRRSVDAAKLLKNSGRDIRALKTGYYGLLDADFPKANP